MKRSEIVQKLAQARMNLRMAKTDKDYDANDIKSLENIVDNYQYMLDRHDAAGLK